MRIVGQAGSRSVAGCCLKMIPIVLKAHLPCSDQHFRNGSTDSAVHAEFDLILSTWKNYMNSHSVPVTLSAS